MAKKAVRGGAPPHKNNLIGIAAGGVSRLVPLKMNNAALESLSFILALQLARLRTTWKHRWTIAFNRRFPVAQLVEHGVSNAKIMGSIPRESKS